jgi:hypothetical protein
MRLAPDNEVTSINRTKLELKLIKLIIIHNRISTINRTKLELK